MEPAKIDWKKVDSRFVEDELYEHINAPKWIDFTAPEDYVDDEAWFCKSDCRHPKTAEDFLRSMPSSKSKHLRSVSVSEILPLGDWNRRDTNLKRRGLISSSNSSMTDSKSDITTESKPPNKFTPDSENKNPNFSTPQNNKSKVMKAAIKSSTEKKKLLDESPSADFTQNNRRPQLKSTLSARNLFGGRDILSQISEFCNELKKLATRAKERENSEAPKVEKESPKKLSGEISGERSEREKEKKPLLQVGEGSSEAKEQEQKQRRKKRNEETENIPNTVDLKNIKSGDERLLLQVRTCPPSPQCFSSPRQPLGSNKNTTTTTPLKPSRTKPTTGRGILQELKQSNTTPMKEGEPGEKGNAGANKGVSTVPAAGAEVKSLDMFWFLKPCTFLNSVN
ncbi:DNA ligase 1 isoform X2 [Telopea speciosissima]|uniref:DNA ligase 1 isoform X2 n=1 Tax=Telopea speciosissima TaxID=54955 RepID=UPI001CC49F42|nr:DNA ligase 1 isoform X2 [Telopea speciosissima]